MSTELIYGFEESQAAQKEAATKLATTSADLVTLSDKVTAIKKSLPATPPGRRTTNVADVTAIELINGTWSDLSESMICSKGQMFGVTSGGVLAASVNNGGLWRTETAAIIGFPSNYGSYDAAQLDDRIVVLGQIKKDERYEVATFEVDVTNGVVKVGGSTANTLNALARIWTIDATHYLVVSAMGEVLRGTKGGNSLVDIAANIEAVVGTEYHVDVSEQLCWTEGKVMAVVRNANDRDDKIVIESNDLGETWSKSSFMGLEEMPISIAGYNSDKWFITTATEIFRSDDKGMTWQMMSDISHLTYGDGGIVRAHDDTVIIVSEINVADAKLYVSCGGGAGFDEIVVGNASQPQYTGLTLSESGFMVSTYNEAYHHSSDEVYDGAINPEDAVFRSLVMSTPGNNKTVRLDIDGDGAIKVTNGENVSTLMDPVGNFVAAGNVKGYIDEEDI